jgi:hypothetical protein
MALDRPRSARLTVEGLAGDPLGYTQPCTIEHVLDLTDDDRYCVQAPESIRGILSLIARLALGCLVFVKRHSLKAPSA